MNKKLSRWLRHWAAFFLSYRTGEIGGELFDYANGKWEQLATWNTQKGANAALNIVENMLIRERDEIYVAVVKCEGAGRGYLVVHDSNLKLYMRGFWMGIYEPDEAFKDVINRCRKIADKMGYRRPD